MYHVNTKVLFQDEEQDPYNTSYVLKYSDIKQAAETIEGGVIHTPLCVRLLYQKKGTYYSCKRYLIV